MQRMTPDEILQKWIRLSIADRVIDHQKVSFYTNEGWNRFVAPLIAYIDDGQDDPDFEDQLLTMLETLGQCIDAMENANDDD